MGIATDRIVHGVSRRVGVGLILVAVIGQSGCAKFKSWRQNTFPVASQPVEFGTDMPAINGPPPGATIVAPSAATNDAYLQRFGRPKAEPAPAPGTVPAPVAPDPTQIEVIPTATTRSTDHPPIALVAPSVLPVATEPSLASVSAPRPKREPARNSHGPKLASVIGQSRQAVDRLSTYQVSMNHQERVNGILQPAEEVVMSVRRNPKAVRIEWQEGPHKGREVIYLAGAGKGTMHVHMGDSLLPMPDMTMPPDSPMAMRSSRHPINEAGYETIVDRLESYLKPQASGSGEAVKFSYEGREKPAGLAKSCDKIVRMNAAGEKWLVYIDPDNHLPALIQGTDANGDLLERHIFRDPTFERPELASRNVFDPVARWGAPKGFLSKLARAGTPNP